MCLKFPITTIYPFADQCFDALIMEEFTALEVDAKLKPTLARSLASISRQQLAPAAAGWTRCNQPTDRGEDGWGAEDGDDDEKRRAAQFLISEEDD